MSFFFCEEEPKGGRTKGCSFLYCSVRSGLGVARNKTSVLNIGAIYAQKVSLTTLLSPWIHADPGSLIKQT